MFSRFSKTLLLAAFVFGACTDRRKPVDRDQVDAPVIAVQRASLPSYHSVAGTVRSETTSTLAANVVGTVTRVLVSEGDRVRAGQVLVEIDAREPRAQLSRTRAGSDEAERAIEAATANARLAEATYRRFETLHQRGSASQQEYDEAKARNDAAQADLQRLIARRGDAHAAETQAQAVLDYSSVRAPIDGVVSARFIDPGAQAAPGVPLLTIESGQATRVDANVPEDIAVRVGDRAVAILDGRRIDAHVARVQPSVDPAARSALVKLQLDLPLRAGTYVNVAFPIGARDVLTVPSSALVRHGQLTSVFVVGPDRVARMRLVTVGSTVDERAEILSGLAANEQIVSAPARVRDGVIVRTDA